VTRIVAATPIHLDRAARVAGEAFAFDEPDYAPAAKSGWGNILWLSVGLMALCGLYFVV
jgi:hypothetical protein